jgi:hypothetical protein
LDPLTAAGCTAGFNKESFQLFHGSNTEPVLSGVKKLNQKALKVEIHQPTKPEMTALNGTLESSRHSDKYYVNFVHASLGFPAPTTFMNAARKGFINGTNQYTRLTYAQRHGHDVRRCPTPWPRQEGIWNGNQQTNRIVRLNP